MCLQREEEDGRVVPAYIGQNCTLSGIARRCAKQFFANYHGLQGALSLPIQSYSEWCSRNTEFPPCLHLSFVPSTLNSQRRRDTCTLRRGSLRNLVLCTPSSHTTDMECTVKQCPLILLASSDPNKQLSKLKDMAHLVRRGIPTSVIASSFS